MWLEHKSRGDAACLRLCGPTVFRQDFLKLVIVRAEPSHALHVDHLLQRRVSEPVHAHTRMETFSLFPTSLLPPGNFTDSLLCQRLLLVDAHVEEDGLHAQQHPILYLSRQRVKHHTRHRDAHVEAASVPSDHGEHVRGEDRACLGDFEGDVPEVHHADAHVLQHGQLLTYGKHTPEP